MKRNTALKACCGGVAVVTNRAPEEGSVLLRHCQPLAQRKFQQTHKINLTRLVFHSNTD